MLRFTVFGRGRSEVVLVVSARLLGLWHACAVVVSWSWWVGRWGCACVVLVILGELEDGELVFSWLFWWLVCAGCGRLELFFSRAPASVRGLWVRSWFEVVSECCSCVVAVAPCRVACLVVEL
nr:hypothetical protein Iba_chr11cCG11610 [Ipomoea batatas]